RIRLTVQIPLRIASLNGRTTVFHSARQKVRDVAEFDEPLAVLGEERIGSVLNDFPAELEGVLAAQNREMLQNLQAPVGPDMLWKIAPEAETATACTDLDEGEAEKSRIGYSSVNAVGERIDAGVVRV